MTITTAKRARDLIRAGREFRLLLALSPAIEMKLSPMVPAAGIVLETGETIVLVTLVVTVGAVVAYAIYMGYTIRLYREGKKWYCDFTKTPLSERSSQEDGDQGWLIEATFRNG